MKTRAMASAIAALALAASAHAADGSSAAIVRLLNSRAAGSPKEYAEAAEIVSADAAAGRPLQQFVIAVVSSDDYLPARLRLPKEKRAEYIEKTRDRIRALAEQKNNALAWYLLSLEKNETRYLKLAADGENVQALNAWGTMNLTGALRNPNMDTNDVERVMVECFGAFKKAADQGDANGLYNLGMCYLSGYGCKQDKDLAFKCFRASADTGHPEAINNIGGFYRDGIVVERNLESAAKNFERSANLGNDYGLLNFALALQRGEGVEKDSTRAAGLFKEAAMRGNAEAMNSYGMCFFTGDGVGQDDAVAVKWFLASASRGFPPAMDNLSACYDLGRGVKKDTNTATVWKVRGMAARGDRNAAAWLQQNDK